VTKEGLREEEDSGGGGGGPEFGGGGGRVSQQPSSGLGFLESQRIHFTLDYLALRNKCITKEGRGKNCKGGYIHTHDFVNDWWTPITKM
jgi:hypothetical protein